MRLLLLLAASAAVASAAYQYFDPAHQARLHITKKIRSANDLLLARTRSVQSDSFRRSSNSSTSVCKMTDTTLDTYAKLLDATVGAGTGNCYKRMFAMYKAPMCGKCKTYALFSGKHVNMNSQSEVKSVCTNSCFGTAKKMIMDMVKLQNDKKCCKMFGSCTKGKKGTNSGGVDGKAMLKSFGLMCAKNKAGKYCSVLSEQHPKQPTTKKNPTRQELRTSCIASADMQKWLTDMGCCFGTSIAMQMSGTSSASEKSAFRNETRVYANQARLFNFKIRWVPCGSGSFEKQAVVKSKMKMKGITKAQFTGEVEDKFIAAVAKTSKADKNSIIVTGFKEQSRRVKSLEVDYQITLAGDAADSSNTAAMTTALSNTAELQKNIKAEGGALANTEVTSSTTTTETITSPASISTQVHIGVLVGAAVFAMAAMKL